MAYIPNYNHDGECLSIQDDELSIPLVTGNRHYDSFVKWLKGQGKTLETWLAENPYVPPIKTQEELDAIKMVDDIKKIDPNVVIDPVVKLLLKREQERIR